MNSLYLGSTSSSRQLLLTQAHIPFILAGQSADESLCDWTLPLQQVVQAIALYKMEHVLLPEGKQGDICYVLTADTLTQNSAGELEGKPVDRADAIKKLKGARAGVITGTAFCLDKREHDGVRWAVQERLLVYKDASYHFIVPDDALDYYLDQVGFMGSCAIAIEGIGGQFLRDLNGSYTAVIGLPMYELRQALQQLHFF